MPKFEMLGSLIRDLNLEFQHLYFLLLPVVFGLSLAIEWMKNPVGGPSSIDIVKRVIISTLLLIAFPEIAQLIVTVADGIADKIDKQNTLTTIIRMAGEKANTYTLSKSAILLQFNDLFIAVLSFGSYVLLYFARYITIAMYHFFWLFLTVSAPLVLLCNIFPGASSVTKNLFRGMIEVASWKIVWALLSAMLSSLAYGDIYKTEGTYITLTVMNFVIALAMIATPAIVKSLVGPGIQNMAGPIGVATVAAMAAAPARIATVVTSSKEMVNDTVSYVSRKINNNKKS
jgi:hypothetical protein